MTVRRFSIVKLFRAYGLLAGRVVNAPRNVLEHPGDNPFQGLNAVKHARETIQILPYIFVPIHLFKHIKLVFVDRKPERHEYFPQTLLDHQEIPDFGVCPPHNRKMVVREFQVHATEHAAVALVARAVCSNQIPRKGFSR